MLVGVTGFVGIDLPPPWRITKAIVTPEVQTTVREGPRHWVAAGETRHVVFDPGRRVRTDLLVQVAPGVPRGPFTPLAERAAGGAILIHGHRGEYQLGRRREGWLSRRLVPAVRVRHYCDRTHRTITLQLSGAVEVAELQTLLEAVARLECHGPMAGFADPPGEPGA